MPKLCKYGHTIGSVDECRACKSSRNMKKKWKNPTEAMLAAVTVTSNNLNTSSAVKKRNKYFQSELHKGRARRNAKLLASKRRSGLVPPQRQKTSSTKPELAVMRVLDSFEIKYVSQQDFGPYIFDFYLPDFQLLIEVQGEYWHSLPNNIANDLSKMGFINNNYSHIKLCYINEIETIAKHNLEKIISQLTGKSIYTYPVDLDKVQISPVNVDLAAELLAKFHYLPRFRKGTKHRHGVWYNDVLIGTLIYSQPSYNSVINRHGLAASQIVELCRFVLHDNYHVNNLASFVISKSLKLLKRDTDLCLVVSFSDPHFGHSGIIYRASNWVFDGQTKPSYYYKDSEGGIIHKKVLWDHAHKHSLSEATYAVQAGLVRVDCEPKDRFMYWLRRPTKYNKLETNTVITPCMVCGNEFSVSKKALHRAILKCNGYRCHSCGISTAWSKGVYKDKCKRTELDPDEIIQVTCSRCSCKSQLKRRSGHKQPYFCHRCSMIHKWDDPEYINKQHARWNKNSKL